MSSIEVSLYMPAELGSRVISRQSVRDAVSANPDITQQTVGSGEVQEGAFKDFGATLIAVAGTAAGVAAVKGLFDVIKTAVQEAYKARRERYAADANLKKIALLIAHRRTEFDLDAPLASLEAELERALAEACRMTESGP